MCNRNFLKPCLWSILRASIYCTSILSNRIQKFNVKNYIKLVLLSQKTYKNWTYYSKSQFPSQIFYTYSKLKTQSRQCSGFLCHQNPSDEHDENALLKTRIFLVYKTIFWRHFLDSQKQRNSSKVICESKFWFNIREF